MRRGLLFLFEGKFDLWELKKEECRALIDNDDQQDDFESVLNWCLDKSGYSEKKITTMTRDSSRQFTTDFEYPIRGPIQFPSTYADGYGFGRIKG